MAALTFHVRRVLAAPYPIDPEVVFGAILADVDILPLQAEAAWNESLRLASCRS
jgi:hypothetical protein